MSGARVPMSHSSSGLQRDNRDVIIMEYLEYNIKKEPGVKRELLITNVKREKVDLGAVEATNTTNLEREEEHGHNPDWEEWVQEEESRTSSSGSPDSVFPAEVAENQFSYPRPDPNHCYDQYQENQYQEPYSPYPESQGFYHHPDRPPLDFGGMFHHQFYPNWHPPHWPQEHDNNSVTTDDGSTYTMLQRPKIDLTSDPGLQVQNLRPRSVPESQRLPAPELPDLSDKVSSPRCDFPEHNLPKVLTPIQTNIKMNHGPPKSPDHMVTGMKKDPVPIMPRLAPTSCSNCGTTSTSLWRRDKVCFPLFSFLRNVHNFCRRGPRCVTRAACTTNCTASPGPTRGAET